MRLERQHDALAWAAWHTAYLPYAKRRPKLSALQVKKAKRVQSIDEQMAIAHAWTAAIKRMSAMRGEVG